MTYLKYVSYLYLVMAAFFVYSGIMSIIEKESVGKIIVCFAFAGAAVFMFFFRRNFQKKFEQGNPKK